jgi:hypothetical protein
MSKPTSRRQYREEALAGGEQGQHRKQTGRNKDMIELHGVISTNACADRNPTTGKQLMLMNSQQSILPAHSIEPMTSPAPPPYQTL